MTRTHAPILITGAAGKTGRAVIGALASKGAEVRALVRRPEQRQAIASLGAAEIVDGDIRSRDAVAAAVEGVAAIYHICPNVHPDEIGIGRRVLAAAREAGVGRLVFHSVLHPQVEAMPHHWAKMRVEELIFESGLEYTILQPAPYMQNILGQWRQITERRLFRVPYLLDSRIAMVDLAEVAEVAALVLTGDGHAGATYELCGPGLPNPREIAAALGHALGRTVRAEAVPPRKWAKEARAAGLDDRRLETLLAMFRYYESFGLAGAPLVLEALLGRPPIGFEGYVARLVSERGEG